MMLIQKHFIKIMIVNDIRNINIKNSLNKFLWPVEKQLNSLFGSGLRFTNFYDHIYYSLLPQRYAYSSYVETVECLRRFIFGFIAATYHKYPELKVFPL